MIDAGELTTRGAIYRNTPTRQGVAEVSGWAELFPAWAKISASGGREFMAARANSPQLTHEITIRYRQDFPISPVDRYVAGSREFDIQAVINVKERNEEWSLHCVERIPEA